MTDLVFKGQNDRVLTDSLLAAEKFGKRHADAIRSIDNILNTEDESPDAKMRLAFVSTTYEDATGKSNPAYIMNQKGFSISAMGWNGIKALKFKNEFYGAFEAMERALKGIAAPQTYAEALRRLADEVEGKERTKALLGQKTGQPDESRERYGIKRWAKEHNMNRRSINRRKMKALSYGPGYEIKKIFDAGCGRANICHVNVFKTRFQ